MRLFAVIAGSVVAARRAVMHGILFVVLGLLVEPGGVSLFT